jgi:serine/threonine kinase 38
MDENDSWMRTQLDNKAANFKSVLANAEDRMEGLDMRAEAAGRRGGGEGGGLHTLEKPPAEETLASSITRQKVAAAKQYIENHYKSQMKSLQERRER